MSNARIRPFYCGSQFDDWEATNCARCVKGWRDGADGNPTTPCDIANALLFAFWDDGTVSIEIANRMGYVADEYCWPCGEVEWTAAWKDEYCAANPDAAECLLWATDRAVAA